MAAGDISKALNAKVRVYLEESSNGFWTDDTEIYPALTDGQREIINYVLTVYKMKSGLNGIEQLPQILRDIQTNTTGTGTASLPADFLYPAAVTMSGGIVRIRHTISNPSFAKAYNTYLAATASQPVCYFSSSQIVFESGSGSIAWTLQYFKVPSDITSSVDPTLGALAYNAIVEYATAFLLRKDENPRSETHYQNFFQLLQNLTV